MSCPSFRDVASALLERHLPNTSSAQLGVLREIQRIVAERIRKIESACAPEVRGPRPEATHARDETTSAVVRNARPRMADEEVRSPRPEAMHARNETATSAVGRAARPAARSVGRAARRAALKAPHGTVTVVAGGRFGLRNESVDSDLAGITKLPNGALLIVDNEKHCIYKLHSGSKTIVAGNRDINFYNDRGFGSSDGAGDVARFFNPGFADLDSQGRLLVADTANHRIRMMTMEGESATVATFAGTGIMGSEDGPVAHATFTRPRGAVCAPDGTVFISEHHRIRAISPEGIVSTLAGSGEPGYGDGMAENARFDDPSGLAIGPDGALYLADRENHCVRRVTREGLVTSVTREHSGQVGRGFREGGLFCPTSVAVASDGTIFVADFYHHRVRQICNGVLSTLAGSGLDNEANASVVAGLGAEARIPLPTGLFLDKTSGLLYVTSTSNDLEDISSVLTIAVQTRFERWAARVDPLFQTWLLAQKGRSGTKAPTTATGNEEMRTRRALDLLVDCPEIGVFARVATFAFSV